MDKIILQQNKHWKEPYSGIINRELMASLVTKTPLKEIQVLLGIRRSGKSTLFRLLINHLCQTHDPQTILYLNLDDPYFTEIYRDAAKLYQVIETAEKLTNKKTAFLFLDEIQNIRSWEKFVKSVYDIEVFKKVFITGSNSSLLRSEYAQLLSGRYIIDEIFPFSFSEILQHNGIHTNIELLENKAKVLAIVDGLMEYGAFPEVYKTADTELKRELLINYYETIVLKDCIANARVREVQTFRELTHFILSNAGTLYSYNGLSKALATNENSARGFLYILENSFLLSEIKNFSYSLKTQSRSRKKAYSIDNGILANVSFRFSANRGKLFENLVFSELKKLRYEIYFYHNKSECDFLVRAGNKMEAIQVCYELTVQNRDRELSGLRNAMEKFPVDKGMIITYDQEEDINNIQIVPFWKYFSMVQAQGTYA